MAERHSEFARDEHDHYVDPSWCADRLFDRVRFPLGLHDPCCGLGTIPDTAAARGIAATGADLVDRAQGRFAVQNFLTDQHERPAIVCNPPYKHAVRFIRHALSVVAPGREVAMLCQAKFLFSQSRHPLFTLPETERVIVFSRRPSMPPGWMLAERGEACRGGGAIDYVWIVWRVGKMEAGCAVEWTL